ncbi:putative methyltransferase [Caldalkalibacillus thermarum TA2.A1]|nr:putative methyltransferase [Caldalkalibacillus thermarum TA2.A1]
MGKWFSKLYDPVMEPLERLKFRYIRETLIHKAKGNVLEIGSGTGLNFPYYTQAVKVTAIEPDPTMRKKSLKRAEHA